MSGRDRLEQLARPREDRNRRSREVRARTENLTRLTKRELRVLRAEAGDINHARPLKRGECELLERPCPFVGCRHHLYLDVAENGSIKLNFPELEPSELSESCSLDVADEGEQTLEIVGQLLNVTRERVRQYEERIFVQLADRELALRALVEEES